MNKGVGDGGCIYPEWSLRGSARLWPKGALEVEKSEGKRKGLPCAQVHAPPKRPNVVMFISFSPFYRLTSLSISVPTTPTTPPEPVTRGPLKVSQLAAPKRLSVTRQHGHLILCDPNLGMLTRKPKPRADKQVPGHAGPQTQGEQAVPVAGLASSLKDRDSRLPYAKPRSQGFRGHRPLDDQTLLQTSGGDEGQKQTQVQSPGGR